MRTLTLTALLLPLSFVTAADADAVKTRLDKARTVHASEMASYRKRGHQWLDDREDAARARGNKKLVDQVKADRKHFERTDELPKGAPRDLTDRAAFARSKITRAYRTAIADYTKASRDKDAAKLESELKFVQIGADPTDRRWRWVYEGGRLQLIERGIWGEWWQDKLQPGRFTEINRTADYVEVEHLDDEKKKHTIRFYRDHLDYRIEPARDFTMRHKGQWYQ